MEIKSDAEFEHYIFEKKETGDVKNQAKRIAYFLTEFLQSELKDENVVVSIEHDADGHMYVKCDKWLSSGYVLTFFGDKKKAYELETKGDVIEWISDLVDRAKKKYQEMPEITFRY